MASPDIFLTTRTRPTIAVPQQIPTIAVPQQIPTVATQQRIPTVATPQRIPTVAVPQQIPTVAVPQRIPIVAIQQQIPIVSQRIPTVATSRQIPTVPQRQIPIVATPQQIPIVPQQMVAQREIREIELRPKQIEWANRAYNILLNNYGYIDTSRMGSGKTFIVIWLAKVIGIRLLIICPVTMENVWRTITTTYGIPVIDIISYASLRSKTGYQPRHGYLYRYDNITEEGRRTTSFVPTQKYIQLIDEGILLVFDEIQNIKNKSGQYKAASAMIHQIIVRGGRSRFGLLSGTPFDDETHAINLLRLIGYIRSPRLYQNNYLGTTVPEGLQELITACRTINRHETDLILNETPINRENVTKLAYILYTRVVKPNISGSMPPPDIHGLFNIKNGFFNINPKSAEELREGLIQLAKALKLNRIRNALEAGNINMQAINEEITEQPLDLGSVTLALVKIENAKIYDMARVAEYILSNFQGSKVIVSLNYTSSIKSLEILLHKYSPLLLYGNIKKQQRTDTINLFNTNPNYRVLIMNTAVGGVGVSLHDTIGNSPRYMLISPSYKLLDIIQAGGRIYRDGTMSDAVVRVFYGKGDFMAEDKILAALARKTLVLKGVIDEHLDDYLILPGEYPNEIEM